MSLCCGNKMMFKSILRNQQYPKNEDWMLLDCFSGILTTNKYSRFSWWFPEWMAEVKHLKQRLSNTTTFEDVFSAAIPKLKSYLGMFIDELWTVLISAWDSTCWHAGDFFKFWWMLTAFSCSINFWSRNESGGFKHALLSIFFLMIQ